MIAQMPDHREIYYQTTGTGPALLMVHGGLPTYFESMVEVLSPQYNCIAFDRLGFQKSTRLDRNSTVEEQVLAIEAVHRSVTSAPAWVFGYSSGGNFALAYALSNPDRVQGLLLVEPALYGIYPPEKTPPEVSHMANVAMPLFEQGRAEQGWYEFLHAVFGPQPPASERPPLTDEFLDLVRSFGHDQPVVITWCPPPATLRQLPQPVLIFEGDQSPLLLRDISQRLSSQLTNSTMVTVAGQDHGMPLTAPQLVAEQALAYMAKFQKGPL